MIDGVKYSLGSIDYDYIPIYGTQIAVDAKEVTAPHGTINIVDPVYHIDIITARMWTGKDGIGTLVGNMTRVRINNVSQHAYIMRSYTWTADHKIWIGQDKASVPVRHRRVLSAYLQDRWNMQKLRNRIHY